MIQVHINESDIVRAIKSKKFSPHELALSRSLKCDIDKLDISDHEIKLWLYDDSDYIIFEFSTESDNEKFNAFVFNWNNFQEGIDNDFVDQPFTFTVEEKHDPRNDSRYWTATNFDIERITSRNSSYSKKSRFVDDYDADE